MKSLATRGFFRAMERLRRGVVGGKSSVSGRLYASIIQTNNPKAFITVAAHTLLLVNRYFLTLGHSPGSFNIHQTFHAVTLRGRAMSLDTCQTMTALEFL